MNVDHTVWVWRSDSPPEFDAVALIAECAEAYTFHLITNFTALGDLGVAMVDVDDPAVASLMAADHEGRCHLGKATLLATGRMGHVLKVQS